MDYTNLQPLLLQQSGLQIQKAKKNCLNAKERSRNNN